MTPEDVIEELKRDAAETEAELNKAALDTARFVQGKINEFSQRTGSSFQSSVTERDGGAVLTMLGRAVTEPVVRRARVVGAEDLRDRLLGESSG